MIPDPGALFPALHEKGPQAPEDAYETQGLTGQVRAVYGIFPDSGGAECPTTQD